jgi:hypothetical protein
MSAQPTGRPASISALQRISASHVFRDSVGLPGEDGALARVEEPADRGRLVRGRRGRDEIDRCPGQPGQLALLPARRGHLRLRELDLAAPGGPTCHADEERVGVLAAVRYETPTLAAVGPQTISSKSTLATQLAQRR